MPRVGESAACQRPRRFALITRVAGFFFSFPSFRKIPLFVESRDLAASLSGHFRNWASIRGIFRPSISELLINIIPIIYYWWRECVSLSENITENFPMASCGDRTPKITRPWGLVLPVSSGNSMGRVSCFDGQRSGPLEVVLSLECRRDVRSRIRNSNPWRDSELAGANSGRREQAGGGVEEESATSSHESLW